MIKIRALKKSDNFKDLFLLSKDFFKGYENYHKGYFKIGKLKEKDVRAFFNKYIGSKKGKALVAIDAGSNRIIGYVSFELEYRPGFYKIKKAGYVSSLMVDKKYRRAGVAKKLMERAIKWFEKKGAKYYYLETSVKNHEAIRLYEKIKMEPLRTQFIGRI